MSDTPRTDAECARQNNEGWSLPDTRKFGRQLERELEFFQSAFNEQGDVLSKVIEQRDRLAEALRHLMTHGGHHQPVLRDAVANIAKEALAAVKGGSHE